jgi:hypothetical protein
MYAMISAFVAELKVYMSCKLIIPSLHNISISPKCITYPVLPFDYIEEVSLGKAWEKMCISNLDAKLHFGYIRVL